MASLSFRDRFFSPPVARAVTSPSGIIALGVGAAIGVVATAPLSVPLAIVGGVVGGLLGYGGRVALALPRGGGEHIDPFGVNEPWRRSVQEAIRSRDRFADAVKTFRHGPLRETMTTMSGQLDEALSECWRVAQQGQIVADARKRINDREATWELDQITKAVGPDGTANETQQRTVAALQSQLRTAQRMDALVASTRDELALINARLDETVTRAIELSVSNRIDEASTLGADVGAIVDDLESLRIAIEDVDGPRAGPLPTADPGPASAQTLPPPPAARPTPPPLPPPPSSTEHGGQSQASPGS